MKLFDPLLSPGDGADGGLPAPRRAGSVTLRASEETELPGVDPANQSLADALRVMLRLLQFGMVALGILYIMSGMQRVEEGKRGIRLLFGEVQESNIQPGFHWTPPYPIGELVLVDQGYQEVDLGKDFWVSIPAGAVDTSIEKLSGSQSLKPEENSGSVITADGYMAHTKWRVGFMREDVNKFSSNVHEKAEQDIVRSVVKRGIVEAVSEVTLNELLQQTSQEGSTVPRRAQLLAQDALDQMNSGLKITVLTMEPPTPPLFVREDFNRASAASSAANKTIQEAQAFRGERLNQVAGNASKYLIYYIDQYEAALAKQDPKADDFLTTIDALMLGKDEVEVLALGDDGKPEQEEEGHLTNRKVKVRFSATGEVSSILSDATLYRTGVRSQAQTTLSRYLAKLEQWKVNPTLMMTNEWDSSMRAFMGRTNFEMILVPRGSDTVAVMLNADPDLARDIEADGKRRIREDTERKRAEETMRRGRETDTSGLIFRGN